MMSSFKLKRAFLTMAGAIAFALWFPMIANAASKEIAQQWVERGLVIGKSHPNSDDEAGFYRRAIEIDPTYASAHFNLAFVLDAQASGNWRERETAWSDLDKFYAALDHYAVAARLDPNRDAAYVNTIRVTRLLIDTPTRRPLDLYQLRRNLIICLEALKKTGDEKAAAHLKDIQVLVLNLEKKISGLKDHLPSENMIPSPEIVKCLSRTFTRGQSPYQGPRVPLMIQFDLNSAKIRSVSVSQLGELAKALKNERLAGNRILIEGHADSLGPDGYNQSLSEKRALSIKRFLVRNFAFSEGRFQTKGYGETRPLAPNDTEVHRAMNRRVEFVNNTELDGFLEQVRGRKRSGDVDRYDLLY